MESQKRINIREAILKSLLHVKWAAWLPSRGN